MEKSILCKSRDSRVTASAVVAVEINLPKIQDIHLRAFLKWLSSGRREPVFSQITYRSVEMQSFYNYITTFWKYRLSFGQIDDGNPARSSLPLTLCGQTSSQHRDSSSFYRFWTSKGALSMCACRFISCSSAQLALIINTESQLVKWARTHTHTHSRGCWLMCGCNQSGLFFFFSTRSDIFRVFMHRFFQPLPVFPRIASILRLSSHLRHLLPSLLFAIYDMPPLHPLNLWVWSAVWRNSITHLICLAKCFLPSDCRSDASWHPCE